MTADDDVEASLLTFEPTMEWEGWQKVEWANILAPLLMRKAQLAYHALEEDDLTDYDHVSREFLSCCGHSPLRLILVQGCSP